MPDPAPPATILVVDDEREHAQVMCEALDAARATSATSPTTSPRRERGWSSKKYDVVVTDLVMEGRRDGLEVLDRSAAS